MSRPRCVRHEGRAHGSRDAKDPQGPRDRIGGGAVVRRLRGRPSATRHLVAQRVDETATRPCAHRTFEDPPSWDDRFLSPVHDLGPIDRRGPLHDGGPAARCNASARIRSWPLRTRLAQLLMVDVGSLSPGRARSLVQGERLGGVFVGGTATTILTSGALTSLASPGDVAPMVAVDEEGGRVQRIDALAGPLPARG